jgi:hypothetical protein
MSRQNKINRIPGNRLGNTILLAALVGIFGCGGNGGTGGGGGGGGGNHVNNLQQIQVNLGPSNNGINTLFTSVTLCVPNSSSCQTISNVLVDTGSSGLRILASQTTLALPGVNDPSGKPLGNCAKFADNSFAWGPVATADVQMAAEIAPSVPIQIIASATFPAAPATCNTGGLALNSVASLGANGILGIGVFRQDCGSACTGASPPNVYFSCPTSTCTVTSVPLLSELQNPVWLFPQDNNGVLISLPPVDVNGLSAITGSLIFGIGTQSDNALGSAQVFTTDTTGNISTKFNNTTYAGSFIDSGSNGIFFLDSATTGIPGCAGNNAGFYCPAALLNLTATNIGVNSSQGQVAFSIANADTLLGNLQNSAFSDLGGTNPGAFDWGLAFFFGRNVFTGIEGQNSPGGQGPFFAY